MALPPVLDAAETRGQAACTTCPSLCRSSCPVAAAEGRETTTPQRLMTQSGLHKSGSLSTTAVGDAPFRCTTCGACESSCGLGHRTPTYLLLARSRVLRGGQAPSVAREAAAQFGVAGNLYGESLEPALQAATANWVAVRRRAEVVYLPGCATLHATPADVEAVARGIAQNEFGALRCTSASAQCCGAPLAWAGELEGFMAHAARFARALDSAQTVVAHDPACGYALRTLYPRFGVSFLPEVQSWPGFLSSVQGPSEERELGVFIPCHLRGSPGFRRGEHRGFRALFGASAMRVDEDARAEACCGAAALLPMVAPATAQRMARNVLDGFAATNTSTWVVPSPRCVDHLRTEAPDAPLVELAHLGREMIR